ncbi:MAG: hypothetical protein V3T86_01595 [Planctomycetota bacterium]
MRLARLCIAALFAHALVATVATVTMDVGVGSKPLDAIRDNAIDAYEAVGFGNYFVGLALVTAVLAACAIISRRRSAR